MASPDLRQLLRDRGMRVTSQRLLIDRALRDHGGHLTAEGVHELVEPVLPGVTQQTVYSTLALLSDLGVARRVSAPGPSTRFEARTDDHHHMVCDRCGAIEDLHVRVPVSRVLGASRHSGFAPTSASMTVLGLCAACATR
ncbi:MAG: transcriptional repressor [Thermoleophilaceae bacterium]|nr:transcriptional repressor [Thermoleophilaceae bacterium]